MLGRHVEPSEYGRLDTFPVDRPVAVTFTSNELQALCPAVDGIQPDIYEVVIRYSAVTEAIESKSLKLLLTTYRDQRIFAEHLVGELADRIQAAGSGIADVEVTLTQNVRGGIATTVTAGPRPAP
ncbi:MAG: 7-cyano-7-deazaguanine reductase [Actinomycetota bacterium]